MKYISRQQCFRLIRLVSACSISIAALVCVADVAAAQSPDVPEEETEDPGTGGGGFDDDADPAATDLEDESEVGPIHQGQALLPPQRSTNCSGETAIVVATDEAAQSDVYSAVTLAGVLDSECIVGAGPRDRAMPTDQRVRLDRSQPGGWIVGGTAAVPPSKTAGRTMKRIAGTDRWHTARLVGAVAADPNADIETLHSTIDAWNPVTDEADCSGKVAIVVASDAAALSDLYSAVTLAGVLGTDCIVFAGPRESAMPADQRGRLARARQGGWIVGGTAAVPPSKTAGREMKRIAGADRWLTALFVGIVASDPDVDVDSLAARYAS